MDMTKMPASPVTLLKPLPKITAQLPLCRRRICGVPNVLPRLLPQPVTFAQLIEPAFHSPITLLAALLSLLNWLAGAGTSSAEMGGAAAPKPPTHQVCHVATENRSPEAGDASKKKL